MLCRPNSEEIQTKNWAPPPKNARKPEPLYCYKTLAETVCYTYPLSKQDRLSAYYGPHP